MNGPIYKFFRLRPTTAWYQLSKAEQDAVMAKIGDLEKQFGVKVLQVCNSSWSNERWTAFGVEEYPDVESVRKHDAAIRELGWFRYVDAETMLGTAWPSDA